MSRLRAKSAKQRKRIRQRPGVYVPRQERAEWDCYKIVTKKRV